MAVLTLAAANTIIASTLTRARALGLPPVGVAVLDAGGHLKAMQAEDGLSFLRVRVCQAKAWGALGMGTHSRHIAARYCKEPLQVGFIDSLNALSGGQVVPLPGGVIIRSGDGEVLGAVGVAGAASEDDEACAVAGLEAAGFQVTLEQT